MDLLEHERRVAALLGVLLVPEHLLDLALDRRSVRVDDPRAVGVDRDDLAVLEAEDDPRVGEEGGDRGGDVGLALAEADDQRALLAGGDERVGMIGVHRDEGVVAAELVERGDDSVGEVAVVVLFDQVRDDLGVGLGAEDVPFGPQLLAQVRVVFDDPVEDDVDLAGAVSVRVGVLLGNAAVGRPASVAEADRRGRRSDRDAAAILAVDGHAELGAQVREVADRAHRVDLTVREQRDARRVVAPVLELLQPLDKQITAGTVPDVADDSAH